MLKFFCGADSQPMMSDPNFRQAAARSVAYRRSLGVTAWWQALPLTAVFAVFFVVPLLLVLMVSFWDYDQYQLLPDFSFKNYLAVFEGCSNVSDW